MWHRAAAVVVVALAFQACTLPGVVLPEGDVLRDLRLRGSPRRPLVALTFDDGPNGRCTEAVLDALRAHDAPATFFVLGRNAAAPGADALIGRMVREGHALGIHSHAHAVRPLFMQRLVRTDLATARGAIAAALERAGIAESPPLALFRPPFGMVTGPAARVAAASGMQIVLWTISVGDWRRSATVPGIVDAIAIQARPGDVIVLHDGAGVRQRSRHRCVDRPLAAEVVHALVPALARRGLRPAPLADVLELGGGIDGHPPAAETSAR